MIDFDDYHWYSLFNHAEFIATGLVSRTLVVELEGLGEKQILISRGNKIGITYDDVYLVVDLLTDLNPNVIENYAVYKDTNNDVWLGILIE